MIFRILFHYITVFCAAWEDQFFSNQSLLIFKDCDTQSIKSAPCILDHQVIETSLVSTDAGFSPGIRSYRDCIKARLPPPVAPLEPCTISPGLWPSRRVCPFPSLCLSHCRCRGAWHAKPFLQMYMCSNHYLVIGAVSTHFHTRRSQGYLAWLLSCEHCKH